jgi:hypothetical protein
MEKKENRIVSHIVSLVLGIISILTTFFWYISLPSGITAIVLGTKTYKKQGKKLGLAGLITGIVGVSICLLIYITLLIILIISEASF